MRLPTCEFRDVVPRRTRPMGQRNPLFTTASDSQKKEFITFEKQVIEQRKKAREEFKPYLARLDKMLLEPIEECRMPMGAILGIRSNLEKLIDDLQGSGLKMNFE